MPAGVADMPSSWKTSEWIICLLVYYNCINILYCLFSVIWWLLSLVEDKSRQSNNNHNVFPRALLTKNHVAWTMNSTTCTKVINTKCYKYWKDSAHQSHLGRWKIDWFPAAKVHLFLQQCTEVFARSSVDLIWWYFHQKFYTLLL